jgi:hypothetical protein
MGHDHVHTHPHRHAEEDAGAMKAVEAAFIAGFRGAPDKRAFLSLSGIPLSLEKRGATALKLIEVKVEDTFRVGSASPGFATRELSYQALPAALVEETIKLSFVYVSAETLVEKTLGEIWPAAPS